MCYLCPRSYGATSNSATAHEMCDNKIHAHYSAMLGQIWQRSCCLGKLLAVAQRAAIAVPITCATHAIT